MLAAALKTITATVAPSYAIDPYPSCSTGPWNVFSATQKSTGQAVSVFVFDRKSLSSSSGLTVGGRSSSSPSRPVQGVISRLKKEAANLARLRHPSILRLVEPVEDTRGGGLMFVTERVSTSLATILENRDRNRDVVADDNLGEVEIQKGLVQIGKALEFLHHTAHLVHGNLTPAAVLVDAKGDWKLSGFGFTGPENTPAQELIGFDHSLPDIVQANLNYASPEVVLDGNVTYASDLFALGLLIVALYNNPHDSPLQVSSSVATYRRIFGSTSSSPSRSNQFLSSTALSPAMLNLLSGLITRSAIGRLGASEFQQAPFFDNVLISTLRFLDELPTKSVAEKSQFMRGLPRVISQFSPSILEKNLIPALTEQTKDPAMLSLAMQCIFKILAALPPASAQQALTDGILPGIRDSLLSRDTSPERVAAREGGLTLLVNNLSIIAKSLSQPTFKKDIIPLYLNALHSRIHALVDAALNNLHPVLSSVDFITLKNDLFPPIASVFSKTSSLAVKISAVNAFWLLCGGGVESGSNQAVLDKFTIQEKVVPLLRGMKTKEPPVMMAVLTVFQEVGKIADIKFIVSDVLPLLWSLSLGPLLNLSQFEQFIALINTLSNRVIEEHGRSLRELSNSEEVPHHSMTNPLSFGQDDPNEEVDFNSLVLGHHTAQIIRPNGNRTLSSRSTTTSNLNRFPSTIPITAIPARRAPSPNPAVSLPALVPQKPPAQGTVPPIHASSKTLAPTTIDWSGAKQQLAINSLGHGNRTINHKSIEAPNSSLSKFPALQPMKSQRVVPNKNGIPSFSVPPPPKSSSSRPIHNSQYSLLDE